MSSPDSSARTPSRRHAWLSWALLLVLLGLRLPSVVQPAGGDQGLYAYAGQRILAGDVMYRDAWDQKPPGIAFTYALISIVWPHESMVPAADLAVAALTACLLVVLGRRRYSTGIGIGAAALFLLFGDPYLQRMSGVYVRAQCEPFMALAVTSAIVMLAHPARRRRHLIGAGLALGAAFWLKYNAAAYGLAVAAAVWVWRRDTESGARERVRDLLWVALGFGVLAVGVVWYFALHGALLDLRLATLDYNLRYSNETYEGPASVLRYLVAMPLDRARVEMLWFLGGLGTLLLVGRLRRHGSAVVAMAWLLAAIGSIAINGSRGLPNYFVQAAPALALTASTGFATLSAARVGIRYLMAALVILGLWRVGADRPVWGLRLATLPGLVENVRYDLLYMRGAIDRDAYHSRFRGQKHDALENDRLARWIREASSPEDPVYVFGFSGGSVCWKSGRISASRFYWSRPVFIEFEAGRPGYGSAGLLEDLRQQPPAVVVLQKEEWRSMQFFMSNGPLRGWLEDAYVNDHETPMFSVWRRRVPVSRTSSPTR